MAVSVLASSVPRTSFAQSLVADIGLLRLSLFAYPRYSHYYFGDYYDDVYLNMGIFPWFDARRRHSWYDPVYEHARWNNMRSEPRWEEHRREDYDRYRADRNLRPARTYREQETRVARLPEAQRSAAQVTKPVTTLAARREAPMKFERVTAGTRDTIKKQSTAVHTFANERNRWEATATSQRMSTRPTRERAEPAVKPVTEARERVQLPKQAERVQVPAPPIVGESGKGGFFKRGLPSQPADEGKDKEGRDLHRSRGSSR